MGVAGGVHLGQVNKHVVIRSDAGPAHQLKTCGKRRASYQMYLQVLKLPAGGGATQTLKTEDDESDFTENKELALNIFNFELAPPLSLHLRCCCRKDSWPPALLREGWQRERTSRSPTSRLQLAPEKQNIIYSAPICAGSATAKRCFCQLITKLDKYFRI